MDAYVVGLQAFSPKGKLLAWTRDTRTLPLCAALAIDGDAMTLSHARCELVWLLPSSQPLILHCTYFTLFDLWMYVTLFLGTQAQFRHHKTYWVRHHSRTGVRDTYLQVLPSQRRRESWMYFWVAFKCRSPAIQ
jgi:hypothetical protein